MASLGERLAARMLQRADIKIGGNRPWDVIVHDPRLYGRILRKGTLGLGEAYMDGWWDCEAIDEMVARHYRTGSDRTDNLSFPYLFLRLKSLLVNPQARSRAFEVGEHHYDIGNDLYRAMLDPRLVYTCGYWSSPQGGAQSLAEAQEAKLDLICRKLGLKTGQRVLDIGCGWGSFAKFAAEKYGARVVGITVSKEQVALARELCAGLPVEIRLQDYREVNESFDHVVSIGMFEHVGPKNYRDYMEVVHRCLKGDGLFVLHTIGINHSTPVDPWIERYIFPNGILPQAGQITRATEQLVTIKDWHSFGLDYDKTLMAWFANFDAAWPALRARYGERFYRMWKYYLLTCAGSFRGRHNQLWQIVLSKGGVHGGYKPVR